MITITCPICGKEVAIIQFGFGYLAVCCGVILYDSPDPPQERKKKA
jgi:hypothetical protein